MALPLRRQLAMNKFSSDIGSAEPLGVCAAIELFKDWCPENYERHEDSINRLEIADDNKTWSSPDGYPGGDAIALFERFGGKTEKPWSDKIAELMASLTDDDRELFRPNPEGLDQITTTVTSQNRSSSWIETLPSALRDYVEAIAEQFGITAEVPAALAIGVASAAMGRGIQIRTTLGRITTPNLYLIGAA